MSTLPLAVRIAAGIAATAVERARRLPQDLAELPVTAVSQALQLSMLVQQRITDLAIKGDDAIAQLRSPVEEPPWAVFDEDLDVSYRAAEAALAPAALPNYSELTLASVRARLRTLSLDDLQALLDYERTHGNRDEFVRMLTNRISTVRNQ